MTVQEMKQLKAGDTLVDAICIKGRVTKAFVVEVVKEGIKVTGVGEDRMHYDSHKRDGIELIPWSDAYGLDLLDTDRMGEPGYLR